MSKGNGAIKVRLEPELKGRILATMERRNRVTPEAIDTLSSWIREALEMRLGHLERVKLQRDLRRLSFLVQMQVEMQAEAARSGTPSELAILDRTSSEPPVRADAGQDLYAFQLSPQSLVRVQP